MIHIQQTEPHGKGEERLEGLFLHQNLCHTLRIGTIDLSEGDGETISIDALMVPRNPLGFELLVSIDTIKV